MRIKFLDSVVVRMTMVEQLSVPKDGVDFETQQEKVWMFKKASIGLSWIIIVGRYGVLIVILCVFSLVKVA